MDRSYGLGLPSNCLCNKYKSAKVRELISLDCRRQRMLSGNRHNWHMCWVFGRLRLLLPVISQIAQLYRFMEVTYITTFFLLQIVLQQGAHSPIHTLWPHTHIKLAPVRISNLKTLNKWTLTRTEQIWQKIIVTVLCAEATSDNWTGNLCKKILSPPLTEWNMWQ